MATSIEPGTQLTEGPLDPKEVLEIRGVRACQQYLVDQVQEVYRSQGVEIHDKHIELIVRQMLRRIRVVNPGDSTFMPAELVDERDFREANRTLARGREAAGRGPHRADGNHQGLAGHRFVAVGSLIPGDHPGAHRCCHLRQVRLHAGLEGERHHRQV